VRLRVPVGWVGGHGGYADWRRGMRIGQTQECVVCAYVCLCVRVGWVGGHGVYADWHRGIRIGQTQECVVCSYVCLCVRVGWVGTVFMRIGIVACA